MQEEKKREELDDKKETNPKALPFHKLLSYADALDWTLMALGTLGSIVHGMARPIGYLLLGKALSAFGDSMNKREHEVDINAYAMVQGLKKVVPFVWYMAFATFPAGILEVGCWMYASQRQLARIRLAFLRSVLNEEIGAFDTDLTSGKIINGIGIHMSVIQDAIGEKSITNKVSCSRLGHFLSSLATFFSGILIATICCWEVALLTFLIAAARVLYQSEATFIVEQREALIKGVGTGMFQTVSFCSWALIMWVGAILVTAHRAKGGDIIAAVMSILFGAISMTYAAPDMQIFNQAKAAGNEVFQVIHRKPIINFNSQGKMLEGVDGNIDMCDVYFAYPSRWVKLILQGFSLSISAGKTVALVGSSGCGKSTIISLVSRFYDPSKGEIFIDKHNIKDLELKFLRRTVGVVSQEPSLFAGTIKDNMKVGNIHADDQQIQNAATMANAHSFISQLPNKYLTEVRCQRGVQLSGGQKQRIAIARAILKDPPIIFLDEATSALDSESEMLVQDALEMSNIINADIIAVVENGQVTNTGTHHDLLDANKFYNNLYNTQNLNPVHDSSVSNIIEEAANIHHQISSQYIEQKKEHGVPSKYLDDSLEQEDQRGKTSTSLFFRIWFGLKKIELAKIVIGSFAAAFSGISKPVFGFFIIAIGVAYYDKDAKREVGCHTLQHYFFGMVGEKAKRNLTQALYSGILHNEIAWFEKPENSIDTSMVKNIIADCMSIIVQCISSILIATVVSMAVSWRMGLSAKGFSGDSTVAYNELVTLASKSTTNIRTIASFCHEEQIMKKAEASMGILKRKSRRESIKYGTILGFSLCLWNILHSWKDQGKIEFQNVIFNYPLRPEVTILNNFNLQIEAGSKVALVGPSGAGKSSILALLLRFYDLKEGMILIDEKDVKQYNLRRLSTQIGVVQQEPLLFNSTVRDNICYGTNEASESELVEVSMEANIHEFVSNLPDEYDTIVGERGCQLSGGQKQRIAIARTLLKRPIILLLDEATSALDAEFERTVVNALESLNLSNNGGLLSSTTRITVAHRLSTVINSDTIVVMDKGEIVEMGTHATLIASSEGIYSRLFPL
ncbi:hypothetical protein I3760_14G000600 [Carya illinoinensis]|nr:hypothetical protein I3760_14G000600 [Carya illinoinensis]